MKKLVFNLLLASSVGMLGSCEKSGTDPLECEFEGRWVIMPTTLYEFSDSLQYTIYSTNGTFGTTADAIPNPHTWWMANDSLYIDLNFGNIASYSLKYDCDCNVLDLTSSTGTQTWTKEGFDITECR